MNIKIEKVINKKGKLEFVKSQWNFYKNDPNFAPPVIVDRMKLLNTDTNPFYQHSKIQLFLAYRENVIVGRIAAITNDNHNETHHDKVGFFGFFECENNHETAKLLYNTAEEWLKEQGMEYCRGPVNPSMNDENAFLIEGFDSPAMVLMPYNPKYYLDLTENAGYSKAKDLFAYKLIAKDYVSEKLKRIQNMVINRYGIRLRYVDFGNKDQFLTDINTLKEIYNAAWEPNWGFVKMTDAEFDFLANDFKQFAIPELAIIVEVQGKPAGFALALPNLNEVLINNKNGSLLGAAWHLLTKKRNINWIRIIVLGVLPEFQNKGVDAVMYYNLGQICLKHNFEYAEASWILEDNEMMNRAFQGVVKGELYKKYRIYEKKLI